METTTDTVLPSPRRLYRPHGHRYLGGVCAGLGRYFDLSPAIYRIAFVVLALAGGTGILVYLAAWAVMPEEGSEDSWASGVLRRHRDHPSRLIGLGVIGFALVLALSEARFWPSPGNLWLALVLLVVGVAWWQLAERRPISAEESAGPAEPRRRRRWPWILVATVLVVPVATALALAFTVSVPFSAGFGNRDYEPASLTSVQSKYELGVGHLQLDLANVPFPVGVTHIRTHVGIGALSITVPRNVTVEIDGRAQVGDVRLLGQDSNGTHVRQELTDRTGSGRVLDLDAHVGIGQVRVDRAYG
ncbi:MAG TPA: PspC domain-containing protein [Gaiellaceae bacterium]|nr:PspC domain-containing protein [Gaiellaceae bacterium]